jgi:CCR4-NOT transcriptional regulation complex NOT5 subunit
LVKKLKALKADLKTWNDTQFGKNKRALLDNLKGVDGIEEQRSLSSKEKLRKDVATPELEKGFFFFWMRLAGGKS